MASCLVYDLCDSPEPFILPLVLTMCCDREGTLIPPPAPSPLSAPSSPPDDVDGRSLVVATGGAASFPYAQRSWRGTGPRTERSVATGHHSVVSSAATWWPLSGRSTTNNMEKAPSLTSWPLWVVFEVRGLDTRQASR
jgi:hypothetical protein